MIVDILVYIEAIGFWVLIGWLIRRWWIKENKKHPMHGPEW